MIGRNSKFISGSDELGKEWSYYAGRSFFLETIWGKEYLSEKIVFTFAYETWASMQIKLEDKLERLTNDTDETTMMSESGSTVSDKPPNTNDCTVNFRL